MNENTQLWNSCLSEIETTLSKPSFSTWFGHTTIVKQESGVVVVGVPNEFVKNWLLSKYHKMILKTLTTNAPHVRNVEYIVSKHEVQADETKKIQTSPLVNELPLQDLYINKEDNLNPRYIFDSFIVGSFNELAYAASQAIIQRPGLNYNPFFVYGGTGLGKTHLIQSIGNAIKKQFPDKKVHYITLEKFYIDCVNAIQANRSNLFKEKYRKYDVLIIDDIQFITNKNRTQEELFHVFNALYDANKQIIFSSDKHPNYIPGLEDRVKSRFSAGMIVDIGEPEYESRLAILKSKIKEQEIPMNTEVMEFLASSSFGNIRELEGSLNSVLCQIRLKNRELTIQEVKNLIKNNIKPKKMVSVKDVVKVVSEYYGIEEGAIYNKTRRKEIVKARQIVMFILREDFGASFPLIGQKLGGKDHTTVIHSCLKIKEEIKTDPTLSEEVEHLRVMFR